MDSPLFETYLDRVDQYYNDGKFMQARLELENYRSAIKNIEHGYDAWGICFALICLEDGEDQTVMEEKFLQKKINKWSNKKG